MVECQTSNNQICVDRVASLEGHSIVTYDEDDTPVTSIPHEQIIVRPFIDLNFDIQESLCLYFESLGLENDLFKHME